VYIDVHRCIRHTSIYSLHRPTPMHITMLQLFTHWHQCKYVSVGIDQIALSLLVLVSTKCYWYANLLQHILAHEKSSHRVFLHVQFSSEESGAGESVWRMSKLTRRLKACMEGREQNCCQGTGYYMNLRSKNSHWRDVSKWNDTTIATCQKENLNGQYKRVPETCLMQAWEKLWQNTVGRARIRGG